MFELEITPGSLTLAQLRRVSREPVKLSLNKSAHAGIQRSSDTVQQIIAEDRVVYGINTGFGLLASTRIANDELELLQRSIVLSHAAGIGDLMDDSTVRLMMVLKINSLARGYSGIRLSVIEALISLVNAQMYPCVPKKGSVGASGDLAPLAHMCVPLIGEGEFSYHGQIHDAAEGLKIAGIEPVVLAAKERFGTTQWYPSLYSLYPRRFVQSRRFICRWHSDWFDVC